MEDFNTFTVVELKRHLREQRLPVSGNKAELISRLEEQEEHEEEFLVLDEEETTSALIKVRSKKVVIEKHSEKLETYCRSCRSKLRYPSGYSGTLTCPKCKHQLEISPNLDWTFTGISLKLSAAVLLLTSLIFMIMIIGNDSGGNGYEDWASGMAAAAVCTGGLMLSGTLFAIALISSLAKTSL